jgi:hypothetical protein
MTRPYLFIVGSPRTGTTLLDKLVSSHPAASALSQPLPLLYVEAKRWFNASLHLESGAFPLNDMFGENYYSPERMATFLRGHLIGVDALREVLTRMTTYTGQYTKVDRPFQILDGYVPASLFDVVYRYADLLCPSRAQVIGSKETFAEEFVPYLIERGAHVVLVVRDPRDVITSLDYGRGRDYGGRLKPLLFNIRQWRKSVAVALAHRGQARFLLLRYEDLATRTPECLGEIARFLGLTPFSPEVGVDIVRDQAGDVWESNSSHQAARGVTTASVGRHRELLAPAERDLIEAACFPEMEALQYTPRILHHEVERVLRDHQECRHLERAELASYQWSVERRDEEIDRWRALRSGDYRPELFLFDEAWSALRRAAAARLPYGSHGG